MFNCVSQRVTKCYRNANIRLISRLVGIDNHSCIKKTKLVDQIAWSTSVDLPLSYCLLCILWLGDWHGKYGGAPIIRWWDLLIDVLVWLSKKQKKKKNRKQKTVFLGVYSCIKIGKI